MTTTSTTQLALNLLQFHAHACTIYLAASLAAEAGLYLPQFTCKGNDRSLEKMQWYCLDQKQSVKRLNLGSATYTVAFTSPVVDHQTSHCDGMPDIL